jgi:hypothetical protein
VPDFAPVIREAYRDILDREPDPRGLVDYNRLMNGGMSEAAMREALLRSPEYALRNPDPNLPSRLGLNVHVPSKANLDQIVVDLGMRWLRVDFDWFRIEPERGRFRWEELDRVVAGTAARGAQVLATLAYTPDWASSSPASPHISDPPGATRFWTDFVGQAVVRYADQVRHWQFWNEPNVRDFWTGSPIQYRTQILEPAANLLRSVDPGLRVVAPGLANLRNWRDWFSEALKAKELIDVVNHHNYQRSGREVLLELERDQPGLPSLRTLMRQLGVEDRPFWLTETGLRSDQGDQRAYYEDVIAVLREKAWVERVFFGIVNEDFSPKPTYVFLRSLLQPSAARASPARTSLERTQRG